VIAPMPPDRNAPGALPVLLHALLRGLSGRSSVTLVSVAGPDPAELQAARQADRLGIEVHTVERPQPPGLARWRRRAHLGGTWLRGQLPWRTIWFAEPGVQDVLDRLTSERRFDVIVVEDNAMAGYRFPPGVPTVLTEYEVRRPRGLAWRSVGGAGLGRWAFREADWRRWPAYQASVWSRFDRIQVVSGRDADAVRALTPHLGERVRVTPFGIDLPAAPDPALEEPGSLLFAGNFTHPPNVDSALWIGGELMPRLRRLHEGIRLTVVGVHAPREVRELASDDIEVTGAVPDVEPYLARASVFLAPVRIGGGMRMKVVHALAMGKAVVTTPRGADGLEIAEEEPPLAVAEDADGLVRETAFLLGDDARRRSLGTAARAFAARHYSADAYARRVEATCTEIVPGRAHAGRAEAE
jgi:glycosyltransferase involved in cell wall biosynthesis